MRQKFLLGVSLLAIAGMWTGCSNEEGVINPINEKQAISFRMQGGLPESRATETELKDVNAFVVYGTDDVSTTTNIFDGVTVARKAGTTDDKFDYNPKRYYGDGATTADFVAYSPVSKKISAPVADFATPDVSFNYEVVAPDPNGLTSQEDLLIAGTKILPTSMVSLAFKHALSRIFVKATNEMTETIIIKGLTLKNLKSKGTITGTPVAISGSNTSAPWTWAWGSQGTPDDYSYVLAPTGVAVKPGLNTATFVTSMEQGMMVLPQTITNTTPNAPDITADDFALEITYDVANLINQTAYVYLPHTNASDAYKFEMGKQYAITVAFNGSVTNLIEISFTITVDPFGTPIVDYPVTP